MGEGRADHDGAPQEEEHAAVVGGTALMTAGREPDAQRRPKVPRKVSVNKMPENADVCGLIKVALPLDAADWHGSGMEMVWAEPVGPGRYRIDNSPFYFFGLSYRDIIEAEPDENGQLRFRQVHERGGHSTYRIMRSEDTSETFDATWQRLHALGCTSEGGPGRLVSVDVPPSTDIYDVYELLEAGKRSGAWDFEEGHCGHPLDPDRLSTRPRGRGRHV